MGLIHRHNRCLGLKLFRYRKTQIEIWFCPKGEQIEPHTHLEADITIVPLAGRMAGRIGERCGIAGWSDIFRRFCVPRGTVHSARMLSPCIFMGIERWNTDLISSAATDFHRA